MDDLLPYYNRELLYLRQMGQEFAERHPRIAGRLRLSGDAIDDPHVARLIEAGAAGLNIEDSLAGARSDRRPIAEAASRVAAARAAADAAGVPLAINARTDTLAGSPDNWSEAIDRANAYVDAGATSIFMLGLSTEQKVADAVAAVRAPIAVFAHPGYISLARLAELGVGRISFGPQSLGLTLHHLAAAAAQLTARGDYPAELGYHYEL